MIESLPPALSRFVDSKTLLAVSSDLDETANFSGRWLIVDDRSVRVFNDRGEALLTLDIASLEEVRLETLTGGGRIVVRAGGAPVVLVRFTLGQTKKLAFAARLLEALLQGEPPPTMAASDLPRACPTCGRPLAEGTSVCPVCLDKTKVMARVLAYSKPYRRQVILSMGILLAVTAVQLAPPAVTRVIINRVLIGKHQLAGDLGLLVLMLLVVNVLQMALSTVRGYLGVWFGSRMMGDVRRDTFHALMRLSLRYFDHRQASQFISRVNSDARSMQEFLTDGIVMITGQTVLIVSVLAVMLVMDWRLALLTFVAVPLMIAVSLVIWPWVRQRWYRQWRAMLHLNVLVGDSLQGIRVVKAFGQEPSELDRYEGANGDLVHQTVRTEGMWQGIFPVFSFLTGIGSLVIWYFGGRQVLGGTLSLGTLVAFNAYLGMLLGPLQWFSQLINWVNNAMAAADRVFEIMDAPVEIADSPEALSLPRIQGRVVFDAVTFGYESHRPVVRRLAFEVEPGEMIGLVGHSGAGKSTIINLICRFYDPDDGVIYLDGVDLRKTRVEDLHRQIGVVLQETFLFDGTVAENIRYSKPDATPAEILRAAKIANAHRFILRLKDGYDTRVGERGHRMSGGEKQRLAIARAVLHDPRILILDEATASLDTETEGQIQEALARLVEGRTTFAIAHRLSTLRNADRLLVLDQGQIAEFGTHEELLRRRGHYFRLVEAQRRLSRIRGVEA